MSEQCPEPPKLSICIVTDSQLEKSRACLASIYRHRPKAPFEIVFLDNASANHIHKMVEKEFPAVRVILNAQKHPFGHNFNKALAEATGEYALILNDDTEIIEDALNRGLHVMDGRRDIGLLGAQQLLPSGKVLPSCARDFPTLSSYAWSKLFLSELFPRSPFFSKMSYGSWDRKSSREVGQVSGAFMLVRKAIVDELGGFDENFVFYYEDTDLCRRIRDAGWKIWYEAGCKILHHHGSTIRKRIRSRGKIEEFRSAVYYFEKHAGGGRYGVMKMLDMVHNLSKVALFLPVDPSSSRAMGEVFWWHVKHWRRRSVLEDRIL